MEKLKILTQHLTFSEALYALKERKWIKVPEWDGYWFLRGGKIIVKTWDGRELDNPWLIETVLREDWQVVEIDPKWEKEQQKIEMEMFKSINSQ